MRIIAGKSKGITLLSVPGQSTRPILDRVKTSLFDILRPQLEGIQMLDLFAGSGSVGIEALSQGAAHCTFLDMDKRAYQTIQENLKRAGLESEAEVRNTDAFGYLRSARKSFDLIYVAPPQYKALWIEALRTIAERPDLLGENGQVIAQIDPSEYEALSLSQLSETQQRRYGNTLLVFFIKVCAI